LHFKEMKVVKRTRITDKMRAILYIFLVDNA